MCFQWPRFTSCCVMFSVTLISLQNNSNFPAWWQHWDDSIQFGWSLCTGGDEERYWKVAALVIFSGWLQRPAHFSRLDRHYSCSTRRAGTPIGQPTWCGFDSEAQITVSINPGFDCFYTGNTEKNITAAYIEHNSCRAEGSGQILKENFC